MAKQKPNESSWQTILDLTLVPAVARLPEAVRIERRDVAARSALVWRIHSEFEEMPGLSLTADQASKLFGVPVEIILRILLRLSDAQVLRQRSDGQFARLVDGS